MKTVTCLLVGVIGLALNATCAYLFTEDFLWLFVLLSVGMILIGFLPQLKQWKYHKVSTQIMACLVLGYVCFFTITVIATSS